MIDIGCVKCPRYGSYRLDKLIAICGPRYNFAQAAAFMFWDCPKRQAALIDDPCGARCLDRPRQ